MHLVATTLDWLARALGYPSRHAYAALYGPQLLHYWLIEGGSIDSIVEIRGLVAPSEAAAADASSFAASCAPFLVGALVLMQDIPRITRLAELLSIPSGTLLQKHLDSVLALTYPGMKSSDPATRTLCQSVVQENGFLRSTLGPDFNRELSRNAISAIGKMLIAAQDPGDPTALEDSIDPGMPFFRPDTVVAAIKDTSKGNTPEEKEKGLWNQWLGEGQVARVLLEVATHLGRAQHPRHLTKAKGALRAVLMLLDSRVARPATLRYVLSILLRLLRTATLRPTSCILLSSTIAHVFSAGDEAIQTLGAMLPAVISALVEAVEESVAQQEELEAAASQRAVMTEQMVPREDVNQLLRLLENLTVRAPKHLLPFLPMVDPIPARVGMEGPSLAVEQRRCSLLPAQQLSQFASKAASMPPSLRRRSMKALRAVLARDPAALYESFPATMDDEEESVDQSFRKKKSCTAKPEVAAAAWKLAVLSADLGDPRLAEFAGELLAVAGPLQPTAISFDATALQGNAATAAAEEISSSSSSTSGRSQKAMLTTVKSIQSTWTAALEMLCDYVIDEDTAVVHAAQGTLRHLLATPQGREAEKGLDPGKQCLVSVFEGTTQPPKNSWTSVKPAEAVTLWNIAGRPYAQWVCDLAYTLLKRVRFTYSY